MTATSDGCPEVGRMSGSPNEDRAALPPRSIGAIPAPRRPGRPRVHKNDSCKTQSYRVRKRERQREAERLEERRRAAWLRGEIFWE